LHFGVFGTTDTMSKAVESGPAGQGRQNKGADCRPWLVASRWPISLRSAWKIHKKGCWERCPPAAHQKKKNVSRAPLGAFFRVVFFFFSFCVFVFAKAFCLYQLQKFNPRFPGRRDQPKSASSPGPNPGKAGAGGPRLFPGKQKKKKTAGRADCAPTGMPWGTGA